MQITREVGKEAEEEKLWTCSALTLLSCLRADHYLLLLLLSETNICTHICKFIVIKRKFSYITFSFNQILLVK